MTFVYVAVPLAALSGYLIYLVLSTIPFVDQSDDLDMMV